MEQFETVATVQVGAAARIYEHGWQSWSVSGGYAGGQRPQRPPDEGTARMDGPGTRRPAPADAFQGEGLLAVDPGDGGGVVVVAASSPTTAVPTVRATVDGATATVSADGPVTVTTHAADGTGFDGPLGSWADSVAGPAPLRPAPTIWCSWYHYFTKVTEADMVENIAAIAEQDLPVDVVQLDDGYQAELGDWLTLSDRFGSLAGIVARIRDTGRRAGVWVAPFLAGARSALVAEHPDWLVGGRDAPVWAGHNWNQDVYGLDLTHPAVRAYLGEVFGRLLDTGFDFFKIDFLYAGALDGARTGEAADPDPIAAYRSGLALIREVVGEAYLLGCGAPLLPSIGAVDAMRISPDTGPGYEPPGGNLSKPAVRSAITTGRARRWQHGRWWVNDPDCLLARPAAEHREEFAAHVAASGGLRGFSDRVSALDGWGTATVRALLGDVPPPTPFQP
jgi:alpha-galactosidase